MTKWIKIDSRMSRMSTDSDSLLIRTFFFQQTDQRLASARYLVSGTFCG